MLFCKKRHIKRRHSVGLRHPVDGLQGGDDPQNAFSLEVISREIALQFIFFLWRKMTCTWRHPMGLRHPVPRTRANSAQLEYTSLPTDYVQLTAFGVSRLDRLSISPYSRTRSNNYLSLHIHVYIQPIAFGVSRFRHPVPRTRCNSAQLEYTSLQIMYSLLHSECPA